MKKKGWKNELYLVAIALFTVGVILILVWMFIGFNGRKTETGENPEPERTHAVTCTSREIDYLDLRHLNGEVGHKLDVRMVFKADKLNVLSLYYDMQFVSEDKAREAFDELSLEVNMALSHAGLINGEKINARAQKNQDRVVVNVYIKEENISSEMTQFVMVSGELPRDQDGLVKEYEELGFLCAENSAE